MSSSGTALTVVIPVWGARYVESLGRAVASVRREDDGVPIIIVDNASDVEVPEVPGTSLVRSTRRLSVGEARNLGLRRVESELVVILDADDELTPGALAALRTGIDADPGIAVYSMSVLEGDTGVRHRTPRRFVPRLARNPRLFALATAIWSLYPIQGCAVMRTPWVRDAGGYPDCDWGDDWVLAVSQAFRGRVVLDPRPGRVYHAHPESLWRQGRPMSDLLAAARQVRGRLATDPAVPRWARVMLPLVATLQTLLILVIRPVYRACRGGRVHPPRAARADRGSEGESSPRVSR